MRKTPAAAVPAGVWRSWVDSIRSAGFNRNSDYLDLRHVLGPEKQKPRPGQGRGLAR